VTFVVKVSVQYIPSIITHMTSNFKLPQINNSPQKRSPPKAGTVTRSQQTALRLPSLAVVGKQKSLNERPQRPKNQQMRNVSPRPQISSNEKQGYTKRQLQLEALQVQVRNMIRERYYLRNKAERERQKRKQVEKTREEEGYDDSIPPNSYNPTFFPKIKTTSSSGGAMDGSPCTRSSWAPLQCRMVFRFRAKPIPVAGDMYPVSSRRGNF
jgi:hypothetical protein